MLLGVGALPNNKLRQRRRGNMEPLPNPDPHARQVGAFLSLLLGLFKADVRPNISWQRRWYDRIVRVIGALILFAILGAMLYASLTRNP